MCIFKFVPKRERACTRVYTIPCPLSKQLPFVSSDSLRCHFSPPLRSLKSLGSPNPSFRSLTSHPAVPHFPRSACCVLLTLASSVRRTDDVLHSSPLQLLLLSAFPIHQWSNDVREAQLIRRTTLMTGGSVWTYMSKHETLFSLSLKNQSILDVSDTCGYTLRYNSIEKQLLLPYVCYIKKTSFYPDTDILTRWGNPIYTNEKLLTISRSLRYFLPLFVAKYMNMLLKHEWQVTGYRSLNSCGTQFYFFFLTTAAKIHFFALTALR